MVVLSQTNSNLDVIKIFGIKQDICKISDIVYAYNIKLLWDEIFIIKSKNKMRL